MRSVNGHWFSLSRMTNSYLLHEQKSQDPPFTTILSIDSAVTMEGIYQSTDWLVSDLQALLCHASKLDHR